MTARDDTQQGRNQGADLATQDHWPACPRCGDLCEPGSVVCVECGCRLVER